MTTGLPFPEGARPASPYAVDGAIGGVPAAELAEAYGTPLFLLDLDRLDLEIARFAAACAPHGIAVGYAAKALLVTALAEHLAATSLRLDVCSLGELVTAERGGFPAGRLYFHGCGKTDAELRADRRAAGRLRRDRQPRGARAAGRAGRGRRPARR